MWKMWLHYAGVEMWDQQHFVFHPTFRSCIFSVSTDIGAPVILQIFPVSKI